MAAWINKKNKKLMLKTPTRKREFSEFRNSPTPNATISRRTNDNVSPARALTPTHSRQLLTPTQDRQGG